MSKRFVGTEIWNKEWFQLLNLKEKLLVKFLFENCDIAGVWNSNYRLASFIIGENVNIDDILSINNKHQLYEFFGDKVFIPSFIKFQYGNLSKQCNPHKPIIDKLTKYGLVDRFLSNTTPAAVDGDYQIYGKYLNVCLKKNQYDKLLGICASSQLLNEIIDNLSENIEEGKEKPYDAQSPNAHYVRLDKYRKFRLQNPHKFKTHKSELTSIADKWLDTMTKKGKN